MRILQLIALLAIGNATAAGLDIKGLTLGMPQADVVARLDGLNCPVPTPPKALDECVYERVGQSRNVTELNTLAGELVERWIFNFADGKLGEITIFFPHSSFATVRAAAREKYGKPLSSTTDTFTNRMGAQFHGAKDGWGTPGAEVLTLREYIGDVNTSAIMFSANWFMAKEKAGRATEAKKKAKDL